jgi:hypothetical protein
MSECPQCKAARCCNEDILSYDLTGGSVYFNEQTSINFECPPGFSCIPGTYTVPAGRIRLVVNTNGQPNTLRLQCCQSELVRDVPADATPEQIGEIAQQMVNACAVQQANCDAYRYVSRVFTNEAVSSNPCASTGRLLGWIGTMPGLPPVVTWSEGELHVAEGVFSSTVSRSDATRKAQTFLDNFGISLVFGNAWECGYWNTEQTCPDSDPPVVIPAFTYFSNISQEQANQNALDAGCPQDCFADLANPVVTGIFGTSVIRGTGAYSDKMFAALGTDGICQIDTATNTVDWTFVMPAQIHVLSARDNGLLYAMGDTTWYIVDPAAGGSITYNDTYPSGISLGYYSCTPWVSTAGGGGGAVFVVCYGDTGSGNKYHIVELPLGAPSVVFSASTGFDIISSPGSYDPTRNQYNFKIRDSTLYPGTPERIVTFNSSFTIVNSVAMNTIFNGDGLFYVEDNDTLYYYGRNTLGDGLYPVDPVSLAFGPQIVALGGFPSGQFAYDPTNQILGVVHNSYIPLVDVNTNTVVCDGTVLSANNNGMAFYPPNTTLYVKTAIPTVAVRQSAT